MEEKNPVSEDFVIAALTQNGVVRDERDIRIEVLEKEIAQLKAEFEQFKRGVMRGIRSFAERED